MTEQDKLTKRCIGAIDKGIAMLQKRKKKIQKTCPHTERRREPQSQKVENAVLVCVVCGDEEAVWPHRRE